MNDASLVQAPARVAKRDRGSESCWLASLKVRAAGVKKGFNSSVRWEKLDATKKAQAGHFLPTALPVKFSIKFHCDPVRRRCADVLHGQVKHSAFKNKINDADIRAKLKGKNLYELTLKNKGGLVTPIIIEWTFADGSKELEKLPAEIWRTNENEVKKVFMKEKEVTNIVIDPNNDTADTNLVDNTFPKKPSVNKFEELKKN